MTFALLTSKWGVNQANRRWLFSRDPKFNRFNPLNPAGSGFQHLNFELCCSEWRQEFRVVGITWASIGLIPHSTFELWKDHASGAGRKMKLERNIDRHPLFQVTKVEAALDGGNRKRETGRKRGTTLWPRWPRDSRRRWPRTTFHWNSIKMAEESP